MAGSVPHPPVTVPQKSPPVGHLLLEEEDASSGSGPAWAAPVPLELGCGPLRQVPTQESREKDEEPL